MATKKRADKRPAKPADKQQGQKDERRRVEDLDVPADKGEKLKGGRSTAFK